jgi:hypothetical protein
MRCSGCRCHPDLAHVRLPPPDFLEDVADEDGKLPRVESRKLLSTLKSDIDKLKLEIFSLFIDEICLLGLESSDKK